MSRSLPRGLRKGWTSWVIYVDFIFVPFIICLTSYIPDFNFQHITGLDEGQHVGAINELLTGAVPYREVHMVTGPLMQYLPYWLMQILGVQLGVHRAFYLFGYILSIVSAFLLLRTLISNPVLKYSALFFILRYQMAPMWNVVWGGIRPAPGFLTVLFLYLWLRDQRTLHLFFAGMICGLGLLLSQDTGIVAGAVATLCMLLKSMENRKVGHFSRDLKRNGLRFALGFGSVVLPFYCFLLIHAAFVEYLTAQFIDALFLFTREIPYSLRLMSITEILNPLTDDLFMKNRSAAFYAMSAACLLIFVLTLLYYGKRPRHRIILLLSITVYAAIAVKSTTRALQGPQFNASLPIFFITLAAFIETWLDIGRRPDQTDTTRFSERREANCRKRGKRRDQVLFVAMVILIALSGNPWSFFEDRIASLWNVETLGTYEYLDPAIMGRAKGVRVPVSQAVSLNGIVAFLSSHTNERDAVFTFPFQAHINFLANRRSPTRFHTALYAGVREEYMEEVVSDLEAEKPKYIVYNPYEYRILGVPNEERLAPIWEYITTHYQLFARFGMNQVLTRTSQDRTEASNAP